MNIVTLLLGSLEQGLKLAVAREGNKWRMDYEEIKDLRQRYCDELSKPEKDQSDMVIIDIEHRLLNICKTFAEYDFANKRTES